MAEFNGQPLSIFLNWSDLKKNHNKFYIAQVLQDKGTVGEPTRASVYTRYGRVGVSGVQDSCGMDFAKAVKEFQKKCRAKQNKGYTEIKMAQP